jgi:hypothetical protein
MADKKIQIKDWNGSAYDILWPETTLDSIKGLGTFTGTKIPVSTDGGTLTMTDSGTVVGITGAASTIKDDNLTINRALISNASGKVAVSTVTTTQLDRLATATNLNTVSTLVLRDGSGNFSAGTITAALNGNASTATKWANARTITLGGDLAGNVSLDGSGDVSLTATIAANAVTLGTDTTGNYVATISGSSGISVSGSGSESAAVTISNTGILAISATANETTVSTVSGTATIGLPDSVTITTKLTVPTIDVDTMSVPVGFQSGTATNPGINFSGDTNTGIYRIAADTLGFATGGAERLRLTTGVFTIQENVALVSERTYTLDLGVATKRIVYVTDGGDFGTTTSSRRFKNNIRDLEFDLSKLLELRPVTYQRKLDDGTTSKTLEHGFIAEEAEALGLDYLVQRDKEGQVNYFAYESLPTFLLAIIQKQEERIKALEAKIQ